jgi:hypothetical protein
MLFRLGLGVLLDRLHGLLLAQGVAMLLLFKHDLAEVLDDRHARINLPRENRPRSALGTGHQGGL